MLFHSAQACTGLHLAVYMGLPNVSRHPGTPRNKISSRPASGTVSPLASVVVSVGHSFQEKSAIKMESGIEGQREDAEKARIV